jgi:hypothetical protein
LWKIGRSPSQPSINCFCMRTLLQISALLLVTAAATASYLYIKSDAADKGPLDNFKGTRRNAASESKAKKIPLEKLRLHAESLRDYARRNDFNSEISFLIDMSQESGSKRFFVYNMMKDSIELSGLVTHGYGSSQPNGLQFSNIPGSNATSLGRYKIGQSYMGKFGLAYKLHGLDKTNNKAFERFVVLHAHDCVPDAEVAPMLICESQGCPTVSPAFLQRLKSYLSHSEQPVLLSIYQ